MDFKLYLEVLKRHKRLVISGAVLAVVLSVLSYGTPGLKGGKPTVIPRGTETWGGEAELLISQQGFPYGRASNQQLPAKGAAVPSEPVGDESYMANLSSIYSALANSTSIQRQVAARARVPICSLLANATPGCGSVVAAEVADQNTGAPLPLLTVTASAPTGADAARLATTTVSVLQSELSRKQAAGQTPVDQRVELQVLKSGTPATLTQGYSKSIPILVLFAIMAATIALAFTLNNHSENPVRSTRRRLDEGLSRDGGLLLPGTDTGRVSQPEHGWASNGGRRMHSLGLRRADSVARLAEGEDVTAQGATADGSSATELRHPLSGRHSSRFLRGSEFESESRD